jgi:hypothetical protein
MKTPLSAPESGAVQKPPRLALFLSHSNRKTAPRAFLIDSENKKF